MGQLLPTGWQQCMNACRVRCTACGHEVDFRDLERYGDASLGHHCDPGRATMHAFRCSDGLEITIRVDVGLNRSTIRFESTHGRVHWCDMASYTMCPATVETALEFLPSDLPRSQIRAAFMHPDALNELRSCTQARGRSWTETEVAALCARSGWPDGADLLSWLREKLDIATGALWWDGPGGQVTRSHLDLIRRERDKAYADRDEARAQRDDARAALGRFKVEPGGDVVTIDGKKYKREQEICGATKALLEARCRICGAPPGEPCTESCDDDAVPTPAVRQWDYMRDSRKAREDHRGPDGHPLSSLPEDVYDGSRLKKLQATDDSVAFLDEDLLAGDVE